jgi:hypothetical protein
MKRADGQLVWLFSREGRTSERINRRAAVGSVVRIQGAQVSVRRIMALIAALAVGFALCPRWLWPFAFVPPVVLAFASRYAFFFGWIGCAVLLLLSLFEIFTVFPVEGWLYAQAAILFAGALLPAQVGVRAPNRLKLLGLVYCLIAALYFIPWSSQKYFLRRLYSIQPGMTEEDARKRMAGYMQGQIGSPPGTVQSELIGNALFFRHSNDGAYNADVGVVEFKDGKVVKVEFHPD